jgi:hypothetical protein
MNAHEAKLELFKNKEVFDIYLEDYANRRCVEELEKLKLEIGDPEMGEAFVTREEIDEFIARLRGNQPTPNEQE